MTLSYQIFHRGLFSLSVIIKLVVRTLNLKLQKIFNIVCNGKMKAWTKISQC